MPVWSYCEASLFCGLGGGAQYILDVCVIGDF